MLRDEQAAEVRRIREREYPDQLVRATEVSGGRVAVACPDGRHMILDENGELECESRRMT